MKHLIYPIVLICLIGLISPINASAQSSYTSANYKVINLNFGEQPFLTARDVSPPSITGPGPEISELTPYGAKIKWLTDKSANSIIKYGTSSGSYNKEISKSSEFGSTHEVELFGLTPKTTYYFIAKSTDLWGNTSESTEHTFKTPLPTPKISNLKTKNLTSSSVDIVFDTDYFTTAVVEYTNLSTKDKKTAGEVGYAKSHQITLKDLNDDSNYSYKVVVRDDEGHEATSAVQSFNTSKDSSPPSFKAINFETTPAYGKEKARVSVSWQTSEPATSQVKFGEGVVSDAFPYETQADSTLVSNHIVTITGLKPTTTYRIYAISSDKAGNEGKTDTFLVLTQRQQRTILQLILDNLEEIFEPFARFFRKK